MWPLCANPRQERLVVDDILECNIKREDLLKHYVARVICRLTHFYIPRKCVIRSTRVIEDT